MHSLPTKEKIPEKSTTTTSSSNKDTCHNQLEKSTIHQENKKKDSYMNNIMD